MSTDEAKSLTKTGQVRLDGITRRFGSQRAVDNVTLDIASGEFVSLLGPSGCGKTTTLRMIAGFDRPDAGRVLLSGVDVTPLPPYQRDVTTVFQQYALFPHLSVAENVAFGLRIRRLSRKETRARVGEALEMVKMSAQARKKPAQLSGGQQQRVALARALVLKPAVLLLDEPLAALDRKLRQEMQIELKLLHREVGITFVFVTHDQEEALSMSNRIAVMRNGKIAQLADPDTIYDEPVDAFVAGFIGQQNFLKGRFDGAVVVGDLVINGEPVGDLPTGSDALAAIRPEHISISTDEPTRTDDANLVEGTLISEAHLGDVIQQVVLHEPTGSEILVRCPREAAARAALGTPVWCKFERAKTKVFPAVGVDKKQREPVDVAASNDG